MIWPKSSTTTSARVEGAAPISALREGCRRRRSADAATWKPLATNKGRVTVCMNDLMLNPAVHSPQEITCAAQQVREIAREKEIAPHAVLEVFEQWAAALDGRELREVPGLAFLRLWLRRGTLAPEKRQPRNFAQLAAIQCRSPLLKNLEDCPRDNLVLPCNLPKSLRYTRNLLGRVHFLSEHQVIHANRYPAPVCSEWFPGCRIPGPPPSAPFPRSGNWCRAFHTGTRRSR